MNWIWSLSLIVLTIAMHSTSIAIMVLGVRHIRFRLEKLHVGPQYAFVVLVVTITAVGLLLAIAHGAEAALWAETYVSIGAINTFDNALFYSIDTMTTRGATNIVLSQKWRMMGALEAANGVLLFGISTAFIFAIMQREFTEILDGKRGKSPITEKK